MPKDIIKIDPRAIKGRNPVQKYLKESGRRGGVMDSKKHYYRPQANLKAEGQINEALTGSSENEEEQHVASVLEEINQWAGGIEGHNGNQSNKQESLDIQVRRHLAGLKDELADKYYESDEELVVQQKEMIEGWIKQLEDYLGIGEDDEIKEGVRELIWNKDYQECSLTGRTPEIIAEEDGLEPEQLFPKDKKILYVGDPWQRMGRTLDNENMFVIDYIFGEAKEFVDDKERFIKWLTGELSSDKESVAERIRRQIEEKLTKNIRSESKKRLADFKEMIDKAAKASREALTKDNFEGYEEAAQAWEQAVRFLNEWRKYDLDNQIDAKKQGYEDISGFRKATWYNCIQAARGFRDIPDWHNIVLPKLEIKRKELEEVNKNDDYIEQEVKKLERSLIDSLRLRKKTEKAHIIQAMFPELPFKGKSFDRFVASWSISVHVFPELNEKEFEIYWQEIARVLNKDGEAYIFPMRCWGPIDDYAFFDSLENTAEKYRFKWELWDKDRQPTGRIEDASTLYIKKVD